MNNIIWKKPDGGVAVTVLTDEAEQRMAWANENAALLEQKDSLTSEAATLQDDLSEAGNERARQIEEMLLTIARIEEVRDNIGLDSHGHELILQARGGIHSDHACVGHDQPLPSDRTFRNAWCWNGKVDHDMAKCRNIWKDKMRVARAPKLAALDIEQLKGMDVTAAKQALRDVTADPAIEAAKTPEELKAVWPKVLS